MESLITRYRNVTILVVVMFVQVLALAVQVKRNVDNEPTRLIRIWTVRAVTPFEKAIVWFQNGTANLWHEYIYLRGVRQENRNLKAEIERLRLEQVRLNQDAQQARRLQVLLGFKEMYIAQTVAAQVIGSSGSEQSRIVYIDKGTHAGITKDMAVITADGVVGKVLNADRSTAQVLLISDQSSGVGVLLEKSRLQGVLKGTPAGEVVLEKVMSDEQVQPGDMVVTSGGDQIFPKGLPVGTVSQVSPGSQMFLNIRVKPMAHLSKLEEVLVITKKEEREPNVAESGPVRAVDILAQRLPSVPDKPVDPNQAGKLIGPSPVGAGTVAKPQSSENASRPPGTAAAGQLNPVAKPALVKPAVAQKPLAPPPVKAASAETGESSEAAVSKPKAKPAAPPANPQPAPEDKPQ